MLKWRIITNSNYYSNNNKQRHSNSKKVSGSNRWKIQSINDIPLSLLLKEKFEERRRNQKHSKSKESIKSTRIRPPQKLASNRFSQKKSSKERQNTTIKIKLMIAIMTEKIKTSSLPKKMLVKVLNPIKSS